MYIGWAALMTTVRVHSMYMYMNIHPPGVSNAKTTVTVVHCDNIVLALTMRF